MVFFSGRESLHVFFLSFVYICTSVGDQGIKRVDLINRFNSTTCPKPGLGFPTPYVVVLFVCSESNKDHHWVFFSFHNMRMPAIRVPFVLLWAATFYYH